MEIGEKKYFVAIIKKKFIHDILLNKLYFIELFSLNNNNKQNLTNNNLLELRE